MNELALFAGAGGGILAGKLMGWRTVCAVERDAYASQVLAQRQNDGILAPFPIWSDIKTFDGKPWRGIVDVVSGGFPCQDISAAGKGAGITGERSGLWSEFARIIGEIMPRYVFVENSPMLTVRGLGTVLRDLAKMGFDAEWGVLSAADVGAPHRRERIWIVAKQRNIFSHTEHHRNGWRKQLTQGSEKENGKMVNARCEHGRERNATRLAANSQEWADSTVYNQPGGERLISNTTSIRQSGPRKFVEQISKTQNRNRETNIIKSICQRSWWSIEPNVGRVANGLAFGMDRLKAIGNGQVPLCAARAFELLRARLDV